MQQQNFKVDDFHSHELILEDQFHPFLSELAIKISWARRFSCERAHLCQNQSKLIPSIVVVVFIIIVREMEAQRGISNASDMLIICTATLSALCSKHTMTSLILFLLSLWKYFKALTINNECMIIIPMCSQQPAEIMHNSHKFPEFLIKSLI